MDKSKPVADGPKIEAPVAILMIASENTEPEELDHTWSITSYNSKEMQI